MLRDYGHSVRFVLKDGRSIRGSGSLLHDESGKWWPSRSGLVMPFRRLGIPLEDARAQKRFGEGYQMHQGEVRLPPRSLDAWRYIGDVKEGWYIYVGNLDPGTPKLKRHEFSETQFLVFRRALPKLYRRSGVLRIDLPLSGKWTWRGWET